MNGTPEQILKLQGWEELLLPKEVVLTNTEQELITACKAGERKAQKRVYELYAGKMLYLCRRYARDPDHAKDLLHDGFIKVFMNISKFRGEASLQTWISRVMVNNCLSDIRKEVRRGLKVELEKVQVPDPDEREVELLEEQPLSARDVLVALTELPLGYRTVFSLYVLDGYSHREIAQQLGISEGTSKSQLSKSKKILFHKLKDKAR